MLRVIAGKYRGRKLEQPSLNITRPTMDRVKESIFNIIQFNIKNTIVLDLFSGSGSLAIEFVSRGATKVIAIEKNILAYKIINKNIEKLKINNIEVVMIDAIDYVKSSKGKEFDYIFLDPPFANFDIYNKILKIINQNNLLKKNGLIILETKDPKKILVPNGLTINKEKKYGFSFVLMIANNI